MTASINHNNFLKYALIICWLITAVVGYHGFFEDHELLTVSLFNIKIPESFIFLSAIVMFLSPIIAVLTKPVTGKYLFALGVITYGIICIGDVHRITPYMIAYFSLFACFTFLKQDRHIFYTALLFTISGIYIFSGLHKFNTTFITDVAPRFYFHSLPISYDIRMGFFMAAIEVLLGILLFFKKTRKPITVILIVMHLVIMWKLSPWKHGWNYIVIPWNLIMMSSLFYIFQQSNKLRFKIGSGRSVFIGLAMVIWIIPGYSQFFYVPENISMKLYSGKTIPGYISFTEKVPQFESMDAQPKKTYMVIFLMQLSLEERGIGFNPEVVYYEKVFSRFREKYSSTNQLHLESYKKFKNELP
ncbi:MAG: hypothetical protein ACSHWW_02640 [Nonlabens sp.]|uniref:hypothetical protein n=1 Tax=Nonlabens sp. TaxID=1888209 RepID=UPI003EF93127